MTDLFGFLKKRSTEEILLDMIIDSNGELLEHLNSTIRWLLHYCEKNGLNPPNEHQMRMAVERSQKLLRKLPTEQHQVARMSPKFCRFSVDFLQKSHFNRFFTRRRSSKSTDPDTESGF